MGISPVIQKDAEILLIPLIPNPLPAGQRESLGQILVKPLRNAPYRDLKSRLAQATDHLALPRQITLLWYFYLAKLRPPAL
jgi:hypothetical protein